MIAFPAGVKVWIAGGVTDMRRGINTLSLQVQEGLGRDPDGGEFFCFRGRRGDCIDWRNPRWTQRPAKAEWSASEGLFLLAFWWPQW